MASSALLALILINMWMVTFPVQSPRIDSIAHADSENALQASFTYFPEEETPYFPFVFDALDTVIGEAGISSYAWDFDDGNPIEVMTDSATTHIFATNDNHTITLNVTDTTGACSSVSKTTFYQIGTGRHIYVCTKKSVDGPWPFGHIDAPYGIASLGETITVYGIATYNSWPVQQKDMTFEIRNPYGELVCTLVNRTDANGAAQVELFLPETNVLGVYKITARANIRDVITTGHGRFALRQSLLPRFECSPFPSPESSRILFDASSSQLAWNGTQYIPIVNYKWDFGDGNVTTVADPVIEHEYVFDGRNENFTVTLKVADLERCRNSTSQETTVWSNIIRVPQDYPAIQEAVNNANTGNIIVVAAGTYHENVVVNKTVSLIGENMETTIIDGKGNESAVQISRSNVVVTGFTLQNGSNGIYVSEFCDRTTICENMMKNTCIAINLSECFACNITSNIMSLNEYGIKSWHCSNSTISGNNVSLNKYGMELDCSEFFTLRANSMTNNNYSFGIWSYGKSPYGSPHDFSHDIDTSNTINEKPIYYWINRHGGQIPEDAGYVGVINSSNIVVKNLSLGKNGQGILIAFSIDSTIENVNVSSSLNGIRLVQSSSITVNASIITSNDDGIFDILCTNDTIINNQLLTNDNTGVTIANSNGTIIAANLFQGNKYGLCMEGNPLFDGGQNNAVYHNSFINNTHQTYPQTTFPAGNTWDDGFPAGGNYWIDYNGTDLFTGTCQNETGSDGIGDVSYIVSENSTDHYPLMKPWSPPDIAVVDVAPTKTVVGQGSSLGVNVITVNKASKIEAFNISIYANTTLIASEILMLTSGNCTIAFVWNTSEFAMGNYTLRGYVKPLPCETSIEDNSYIGVPIYLGILGDVNADHYVGVDDLFIIASHFGQEPGNPFWDPIYDLNDDCYICIDDIFVVAQHFGQENP